jgi:hypothetical protein
MQGRFNGHIPTGTHDKFSGYKFNGEVQLPIFSAIAMSQRPTDTRAGSDAKSVFCHRPAATGTDRTEFGFFLD